MSEQAKTITAALCVCGSSRMVNWDQRIGSPDLWRMKCDDCGRTGAWGTTLGLAMTAWNGDVGRDAENAALKARVEELEAENERLTARVKELEEENERLRDFLDRIRTGFDALAMSTLFTYCRVAGGDLKVHANAMVDTLHEWSRFVSRGLEPIESKTEGGEA